MSTALAFPDRQQSDERILAQARLLSSQMQALSSRLFAPDSAKALRTFSSGEAARLLSVSDGYLRQLSLDGVGPQPDVAANGRRGYSLAQIDALRAPIAAAKPREALAILPRRRQGEALQTIAVTNFKAAPPRPRRPSIWRSIWRCAATACWRSTSIRKRRSRRCSASSRSST